MIPLSYVSKALNKYYELHSTNPAMGYRTQPTSDLTAGPACQNESHAMGPWDHAKAPVHVAGVCRTEIY
jgi:hypothetical protein